MDGNWGGRWDALPFPQKITTSASILSKREITDLGGPPLQAGPRVHGLQPVQIGVLGQHR